MPPKFPSCLILHTALRFGFVAHNRLTLSAYDIGTGSLGASLGTQTRFTAPNGVIMKLLIRTNIETKLVIEGTPDNLIGELQGSLACWVYAVQQAMQQSTAVFNKHYTGVYPASFCTLVVSWLKLHGSWCLQPKLLMNTTTSFRSLDLSRAAGLLHIPL